ncbi:uncharacterized protein PITG_17789 [Phytophthora infestans T30-4]|uniref:Uncharacterized protein n=1 Tax=Phytophthora infestans (strain T30-4) TaxID=403677 RepID=D0NWA1_PHYIT|nr:uncharacterized protein PITG_17789 [Phytophthora infestans T30-4]EEY66918.1 hypothetical protein PITG_17789 [Phytophthora infestans T30-4]|eukprot:XP_002896636.1 hypothetical protein PITG_17789 [Phytophthora infestans T30-4]
MEQCRLMRVEANNATNDALEAQEMYRDDRDNAEGAIEIVAKAKV